MGCSASCCANECTPKLHINYIDPPKLPIMYGEALPIKTEKLIIKIEKCTGVPHHSKAVEKVHVSKSGHLVQLAVIKHNYPKNANQSLKRSEICSTQIVLDKSGNPVFNCVLELNIVDIEDFIEVKVYTVYGKSSVSDGTRKRIGKTLMKIKEFIKRPDWIFYMVDTNTDCLVFDRQDQSELLKVHLSLNTSESLWPNIFPKPIQRITYDEKQKKYAKHVMMITRGTRGDVQPYLALAIGLAEKHNYLVTIVTEFIYRDRIKEFSSKLTNGAIQFRPSGGDSQKRVDSPLAQWALQNRSRVMQVAIIGRTEREFFDSEPAFYYFAKKFKPDAIVYSFCTANVAMIISESLQIPIIGFILQPTVIESDSYPAVVPIGIHDLQKLHDNWKTLDVLEGHKWVAVSKQVNENNVFTQRLNTMRQKRGLEIFHKKTSDYKLISKYNLPLIVPINEVAFGGKPADWHENAVLSEYIFLRGDKIPKLSNQVEKFIEKAKNDNAKIVLIAFSSMPVTRNRILEVANKIILETKSKYEARVIAVVGTRPTGEVTDPAIDKQAKKLVLSHQLLELSRAPFNLLFSLCDFNIVHGGLGTTAEALYAGKPTFVTGVLLMDQRFWGQRVQDLGVGPEAKFVDEIDDCICDYVSKAFDENYEWSIKAKEIATQIKPKLSDDGVDDNIELLIKFIEEGKLTPRYNYEEALSNYKSMKKEKRRKSKKLKTNNMNTNSSQGTSDSESVTTNTSTKSKFSNLFTSSGKKNQKSTSSSSSTTTTNTTINQMNKSSSKSRLGNKKESAIEKFRSEIIETEEKSKQEIKQAISSGKINKDEAKDLIKLLDENNDSDDDDDDDDNIDLVTNVTKNVIMEQNENDELPVKDSINEALIDIVPNDNKNKNKNKNNKKRNTNNNNDDGHTSDATIEED